MGNNSIVVPIRDIVDFETLATHPFYIEPIFGIDLLSILTAFQVGFYFLLIDLIAPHITYWMADNFFLFFFPKNLAKTAIDSLADSGFIDQGHNIARGIDDKIRFSIRILSQSSRFSILGFL